MRCPSNLEVIGIGFNPNGSPPWRGWGVGFNSRAPLPGGVGGWVLTPGLPSLEGLGVGFLGLYKTIMGTIPKSSSHSPSAAEAAEGVRLLLL